MFDTLTVKELRQLISHIRDARRKLNTECAISSGPVHIMFRETLTELQMTSRELYRTLYRKMEAAA